MAKLSQRQVLATLIKPDSQVGSATSLSETPDWGNFKFAQVSGGEITASVEKIYPGGALFPEVLCAPSEIGDITLTAHYDDSDGTGTIWYNLNKLRQKVGKVYYNISVATYDCDIKIQKSDRLYNKCLLVGITEPDGDSSSGAPATFALTFSVQDIAPATTA